MIELEKGNTYLPFLGTIPVMLLAMIIGGQGTVDFQMHDTYTVITKFNISLLLLIVLVVKSALYYLSREVSLVSFFYKSDVVLTLLLVGVGFYYIALTHGKIITTDAVALMTLLFASWILTQLLVGANYLFLMFFGE